MVLLIHKLIGRWFEIDLGIIKKGKPLPITCNRIKFTFPRLIWFCCAAIFFYCHQVLSVVWWLETLDTSGSVYALEKVSYHLISPTYLIRGLSSALIWIHKRIADVMMTAPPKYFFFVRSTLHQSNSRNTDELCHEISLQSIRDIL